MTIARFRGNLPSHQRKRWRSDRGLRGENHDAGVAIGFFREQRVGCVEKLRVCVGLYPTMRRCRALGSGDEKLWAYILHFTGKKLGGLPIFHVLGKHAASHRALCARGGAVCSGYGAVGDVLCKRGAGDGEER